MTDVLVDITQDDFIQWKNHTVTKNIFKILKEIKDFNNESMVSPDFLLHEDARVMSARRIGFNEGIDRLLNIEFEIDLEVNKE